MCSAHTGEEEKKELKDYLLCSAVTTHFTHIREPGRQITYWHEENETEQKKGNLLKGMYSEILQSGSANLKYIG